MVTREILLSAATLCVFLGLLSPAVAQVPVNPPITPSAASVTIGVPSGTPILVEITDLISTRTAKRDDMFNLRLVAPILLNDVIVIPEGTIGKGQIVDAGLPGMGGKPGKLVLAARYLEFEGRQIPIRGLNMDMSARDNSGPAVFLTAAGGVAGGVVGLIVTGGHMEVQPGTRARARIGVNFVPAATAGPSLVQPSN
ncbi:MAG: hypothetical protein FD163_894 [Hyphomonadaceae bacterium]|nr:MAG: hypothetical protein FD128_517 [Hyphomonadaceae bacterium]KAF0186226.1 MAG: hypothetical protein FD163_894 [Hyphomonadaceae bacterium]